MRIKDIKEERDKVSKLDFENMFDIYEDKRGNLSYNLNSNMYFDFQDAMLQTYIPTHDLHPTIVSYNIYGTPRLAWLICKLNSVKDPSMLFQTGVPVLYLPKDQIGGLVTFLEQ